MTPKKRKTFCIATHDGLFHTDEVFACALLIISLKTRGLNYWIIRTRELSDIPQNAYWIDIGKEYKTKRKHFDHHQNDPMLIRDGIPYSSFGLILLYLKKKRWLSEKVYKIIDDKLGKQIDLVDNFGPGTFKSGQFKLMPYNIRETITAFHPNPMEEDEPDVMNKAFGSAVKFAEEILKREIEKAKEKIMLEKKAQKAYQEALDKRIIILPKKIPWQEFSLFPEPLIVVCPYSENTWATWLVKRKGQSFRFGDKDWVKYQSGVDPIFVHDDKHLIVVGNKEDAVRMAPFLLLPSA